jgi:hypothetical protein
VACRPGAVENIDRDRERLKAAGADFVGTTLSECRVELISLLQVAEASSARDQPARELSLSH